MHVINDRVDKLFIFIVAKVSHSSLRRHQTTGAVIARCGQPEVSWWGWRNADDEHLVQSIAKACAVDGSSRKHLSNGGYTNGHDLPDTDFGECPDSAHHHRYTPTPVPASVKHTDLIKSL